jgi:hypothetical protein
MAQPIDQYVIIFFVKIYIIPKFVLKSCQKFLLSIIVNYLLISKENETSIKMNRYPNLREKNRKRYK